MSEKRKTQVLVTAHGALVVQKALVEVYNRLKKEAPKCPVEMDERRFLYTQGIELVSGLIKEWNAYAHDLKGSALAYSMVEMELSRLDLSHCLLEQYSKSVELCWAFAEGASNLRSTSETKFAVEETLMFINQSLRSAEPYPTTLGNGYYDPNDQALLSVVDFVTDPSAHTWH